MVELAVIRNGKVEMRKGVLTMAEALFQVYEIQRQMAPGWREASFDGSPRRGYLWHYTSPGRAPGSMTIQVLKRRTRGREDEISDVLPA